MEGGREGTGVDGSSNWRNGCKTMGERCLQMWTNTEKYGWTHDVTFEVGSTEKVLITAHRFVLVTNCQFFEDFFRRNRNDSREMPLPFPELDPVAFKKALQYIYDDTTIALLAGSHPEEIFAILEAAKLFRLDGLVTLCYKFLRFRVDYDNVVEMFHLAQERNEERVKEFTRNLISSHIKKVFSSPRFLQLPEDALCALLNMDDWYLDEVEVFEHVKRWSSSKAECQGAGVNSVQQMKAAMGQAFYKIRFPLMTEDEFYQQVFDKHPGLFRGKEIQELSKYYGTSDENCLHHFVSRLRLSLYQDQALSPLSTPGPGHEKEETSSKVDSSESSDSSTDEDDEKLLTDADSIKVKASLSSVPIIQQVPEPLTQPPAKKSRIENRPWCRTLLYVDCETIQEFVNTLEKREDKESIKVINETLHYQALPQNRVHLPNLSEFRLKLKLNHCFKLGSDFKLYVKIKTAKLDQLLFFDKAPIVSKFCSNSENLKILLGQKVNVSIHFEDCLILKVNHGDGELTMNMVTCAQEIVNILHDFPLKKLALNDCKVKTLEGLRLDSLETIVFNGMEGLEDSVEFLVGCSSLREVAWNSSGMKGGLILGKHLLSRNPQLEKASFAKGTLCLPGIKGSPGGWKSSLSELYLDMSDCSYELDSFSCYPNLKRMQLRNGNLKSIFVYNTIKNFKKLEWFFVDQMELTRIPISTNGKRTRLSDDARIVHNFLSKVFSADPKVESDWSTFILEKKVAPEGEGQGEMYEPFNASMWQGVKVTDENRDVILRKLDFEQFSYSQFYKDYETFAWVEDMKTAKTGGIDN